MDEFRAWVERVGVHTVDPRTRRGPLHEMFIFGKPDEFLEKTRVLLEMGADPNLRDIAGDTPLQMMIDHQRWCTATITLLIEHGADPMVLRRWCFLPRLFLRFLLDQGLDLEAVDHEGMTALAHVALYGPPANYWMIYEHGGDLWRRSNSGFAPMHNYSGPRSDETMQLIMCIPGLSQGLARRVVWWMIQTQQ